MDRIETFVEELKQYSYSTESAKYFAALLEAAEGYDMDACGEVLGRWEDFLLGNVRAEAEDNADYSQL